MRGDVGQPGFARNIAKGFVAILDCAPVPFDREGLPGPLPASQVRQKPPRQWHRRSVFLRPPIPRWPSVEDAPIEVDPGPTLEGLEGCRAHGTGARARV